MKTVGDKLEPFKVTGVKPGFNQHEENGVSAFEDITESSFPGKWKVIYFYPKDFTFVCPTEIVGFNKLAKDFEDRDAVLLGGSTDNEFVKLAWRREHPDLNKLGHYQFGDTTGALIDQALDTLVEEAAIANYGVSVETVDQALTAIGRPHVATVQIIANAFRLKPLDQVFPAAAAAGIGLIIRVPLASGLLSGKYHAGTTFAPDDHRNYNRDGTAFEIGRAHV